MAKVLNHRLLHELFSSTYSFKFMSVETNFTGVILAGGKSTRFGTDKAFIPIGDKYLIELILSQLQSKFKNIIISSNKPEMFKQLEVPVIKDVFQNFGPLGGIHSALVHSPTEFCFITACDMPFINLDMVEYLLNYYPKKEVLVPFAEGRIQPLFAVYRKSLIPKIEEVLAGKYESKYLALHNFIKLVESEVVDVAKEKFYTPLTFYNINTIEDFEKVQNLLKEFYKSNF